MGYINKEEHNELCVGIDLGTTNSALAIINERPNGNVVSKVVDISRGASIYNLMSGEVKLSTAKSPTIPSCVYYWQEKNYRPIVGDFAKMQYPLRPHLVAKSIKSQMGRPIAEGLSDDIPDKSPAQVTARILEHIIGDASKSLRCKITDVVITVPANFDSSMCKATRDAAKMAGIQVENADGTERPILLSEPKAVIYDLINQVHNGEFPDRLLDLRERKRVLVFDLGGGTLDITMHEIKRREDNAEILKVDELATNRYTLLGGDDFDEEIAKVMYKRYLKQYSNHPNAVAELRKKEKVAMPLLRVYAEHLKIELNGHCNDSGAYASGWDDFDEEIKIPTGGNMGGIGYSYDDTFTKEEVEDILLNFMAFNLRYDDYKQIDSISDTRNIIYPILDVLRKAADKLGIDDITVDAVIVNGGMSKFYMVTDRLKDFFGFEPIVALNPDQAVARGAAVYHYYLHKYEEMQDDMKVLGNMKGEDISGEAFTNPARSESGYSERKKLVIPPMAIEWGSNILNDCLYLGAKNGAVHEIIPTGAELPFNSPVMTGFRIEPGQNKIDIPIKSKNLDGTYRTIASGNISFKQHYFKGAFVAFQIYMSSNKVINMKAWTSKDDAGSEKIEEGFAEIVIDNSEKPKAKTRFIAPSGSTLQPKSEINNMLQLVRNYEKCRNGSEKSSIAQRIAVFVSNICNAGNKNEFADIVLEALSEASSEEARQRLFTIARKIGGGWSENDKRRLGRLCMDQISAGMTGFSMGGPKVSTNIQAIYTLSVCGSIEQLARLSALHDNPRYLQACLYTHARTKSDLQWLQDEFESDARKSLKGIGNNIQFSSYAIGVALKKEGMAGKILSVNAVEKIVNRLCEVIRAGNLSNEELTCCLLALGWICDQREHSLEIAGDIIQDVLDTIRSLDEHYSVLIVMKQERIREIVMKMLNGETLDADEEQFLLTKLEQ